MPRHGPPGNPHGDPDPILEALQAAQRGAARDVTAAPGGGQRLGPLAEIVEWLGRDMTGEMEDVTPARVPDIVADASLPLYGTARRSGNVLELGKDIGLWRRLLGDEDAVKVGQAIQRARSPEAVEAGFNKAEAIGEALTRTAPGSISRSRNIGAREMLQSERGRAILDLLGAGTGERTGRAVSAMGRIDEAVIEELLSQIPNP